MTDVELIHKKLAIIEDQITRLRSSARLDAIDRDVRERYFVEHSLQIAIQAALDVALHVVSERRLGEPAAYASTFDLLAGDGWLRDEQRAQLKAMAGFRNVLVHGYAEVDLEVVRRIARDRLGELAEFVAAIRARLDRGS